MSISEHHLSHEGYRDNKEAEEAEFTVAWAMDVLKHRYIDGEIEELHKAAAAFDNPTLGTVPGLDMAHIAAMQQLIYEACDTRTAEGLADLSARYQQLDEKIRIVASDGSDSGMIHTALEGFSRGEGNKIYPIERGNILTGEVLEISYKGERRRL